MGGKKLNIALNGNMSESTSDAYSVSLIGTYILGTESMSQ